MFKLSQNGSQFVLEGEERRGWKEEDGAHTIL